MSTLQTDSNNLQKAKVAPETKFISLLSQLKAQHSIPESKSVKPKQNLPNLKLSTKISGEEPSKKVKGSTQQLPLDSPASTNFTKSPETPLNEDMFSFQEYQKYQQQAKIIQDTNIMIHQMQSHLHPHSSQDYALKAFSDMLSCFETTEKSETGSYLSKRRYCDASETRSISQISMRSSKNTFNKGYQAYEQIQQKMQLLKKFEQEKVKIQKQILEEGNMLIASNNAKKNQKKLLEKFIAENGADEALSLFKEALFETQKSPEEKPRTRLIKPVPVKPTDQGEAESVSSSGSSATKSGKSSSSGSLVEFDLKQIKKNTDPATALQNVKKMSLELGNLQSKVKLALSLASNAFPDLKNNQ